jgi:superfamily II DNA or RNA helicase
MRLITSYQFGENDLATLRACTTASDESEVLEEILLEEMSVKDFTEYVTSERFRCLAWMLEQGYLDIRIAYMKEDTAGDASKYHEKIGLFTDPSGNQVAFTGSINETAGGWQGNFESFDVYRSWVSAEEQRVVNKRAHFERLWKNKHPTVTVRRLPEAVETGLTKWSPGTQNEVPDLEPFQESSSSRPDHDVVLDRKEPTDEIELWKHQREAIKWWEDHDYAGIFAMATGTGKTLTALRAARTGADTRLTVIVVPKNVLLDQWRESVLDVFGPDTEVLECSGRTQWRKEISTLVDPYRVGNETTLKDLPYGMLLTTPHTGSSDPFQMALEGVPPERLQLIADEVHNYGAPTFQRIFNLDAGRRIGLSATPQRQWDEEGTELIFDYFGGHDPFRFSTEDAIANGYLSEYEYHPITCELKPYEYEDYLKLTMEIEQLAAQSNNESNNSDRVQEQFERLLRERAAIKKKAETKPDRFADLLDQGVPTPAIIFCEDTEQLEEIEAMLKAREPENFNVYVSARADEQEHALYNFREGRIDYLLAIDCLDEGLDVPDATSAVIISSDRNERQFIQRRGRVLRLGEHKDQAIIYDILVLPGVAAGYGDERALRLLKQELERAKILMAHADNRDECEQELADALESYGKGYRALAYVEFDDG